jgi:hypothetical protein
MLKAAVLSDALLLDLAVFSCYLLLLPLLLAAC